MLEPFRNIQSKTFPALCSILITKLQMFAFMRDFNVPRSPEGA